MVLHYAYALRIKYRAFAVGDIKIYKLRDCTALQTGRSRDRFPMVSLEIFIDIFLPAALWPWGGISP
jgi:hypothetical protein